MEMSSNFVFLEHLIDHQVRSEVHHPPLRTGWLMNLLKVDGGDQWINKTNTSSSLQKLWHLPRTSIRYPIESMHRMYGIYQQNWVFCFFVFGVFQHSPSLARTHESRKMHQQKWVNHTSASCFFLDTGTGGLLQDLPRAWFTDIISAPQAEEPGNSRRFGLQETETRSFIALGSMYGIM